MRQTLTIGLLAAGLWAASLGIGLGGIGLGRVPCAWAQPAPADRALATQLFKEGRALLDQGKVVEACRKLEESQRLDPGGGTLLNLAICHESEGRTATAWSEFAEALGIAKRDGREDRRKLAETHIASLEKSLSHLVIQIPKEADLPELQVKRDGTVVGRAAWGSLMPVDPGEHSIEATAPGKRSFQQKVTVPKGAGATSVSIPRLSDMEAPSAAAPGAQAPSGPSPAAPTSSSREVQPPPPRPSAPPGQAPSQSAGNGRSVAGWVLTGIGVAGTAVGTYFGLRAISDKSKSDDECVGGCTATGAQSSRDAGTEADLATAGFAVGVVALASGIYLLATNKSERPSAPLLRPSTPRWAGVVQPLARRTARIEPSAGPLSAGLSFTTEW